MSKRHGATAVRDYRDMGYLPQTITNYLALLSWSPPEGREILNLKELVGLFDIGDLSASPAVFDKQRLDWLNGKHLRALPAEELAEYAREYAPNWADNPRFALMLESVLDNLSTLSELPGYLEPYGPPHSPDEHASEWLRGEVAASVIDKAIDILGDAYVVDVKDADDVIGRIKEVYAQKELRPKEILMPLRVALTGRDRGPSLHYLMAVFGKQECIDRLRAALEAIG